MRGLRLLWITPFLPRRGVSAARERWWQLLRHLAPRHTITLLTVVDDADVAHLHELPANLAAVRTVPRRPWRPDDPCAVMPRVVAGGYSDPCIGAAIATALATDTYDVVQYEFSEMANCIEPSAAHAILTVHQISFAQQRPAWIAGGRSLLRAPVLLHRYLRELDFELHAVRRVDRVVTMSAEDAQRLCRFVPDLDISVSPCGVDTEALRPPDAAPRPTVDLVFVGNFVHPPNADAARFLVRDVLPRIPRRLHVRIVGHDPTPDVTALASGTVEVTGGVADVAHELLGARAAVAPVRFGTGMRGKVLDALALARPVVTTSLGAEGLGAVSGRHLLIADGAPAFASAITRLLDDTALGADLGRAGRTLVTTRFDWRVIAAAHERIYEDTLRRPARAFVAPSPQRLQRLGARIGRWPAIGLGTTLLAARGVRWHLRRARDAFHARRPTLDAPACVDE